MSVEIKRSCNSNIQRKDDKIVFNSFIITLTGDDLTNFRRIKDIFDRENRFNGLPDREAKILALMLDIGMIKYLEVKG
jgi:hypothetical protein